MTRFGDFTEAETAYTSAAIAILPVPYDGTSTWIKGADGGPEALLDASRNMEFYDIETGTEVYRRGIATLPPVVEASSPEAMEAAVFHAMQQLLADGKFPIVIGGEHSVSIGAIRAVASLHPDITVLQLDAHSDMRDSYEGSPLNHACVMARAREFAAAVTQVGIRSSALEEQANIVPSRIFYAHEIGSDEAWMERVTAQLGANVYVTIDLDVLDPAYMPSTGTPEPDGLTYRQVIRLLALVARRRHIVGFDVVELCPNPANRAPDFLAAKLVYQFLSLIFVPH